MAGVCSGLGDWYSEDLLVAVASNGLIVSQRSRSGTSGARPCLCGISPGADQSNRSHPNLRELGQACWLWRLPLLEEV
jgi:hypothetical protein